MIEVIYKEESQEVQNGEESFGLPRNIRQIGQAGENYKIYMSRTIKNRLAHKRVLTCEFDELSENNLYNQILKTTIMLLLRNAKVKTKYKDDLKKEMLFLANVDVLDPVSIKWSAIRFQRNNQTYRMLISICQLIVEGMLITTDAGEYRLASFADE